MPNSVYERMSAYKEVIEAALDAALPVFENRNPAALVRESMRYSLLAGGKRIRAMLCLAFCELCGGEVQSAVPYACALEMVHAYSLIHDDLPCMDDDDLRRGKPTNHKVYGESIALLAGDALLTKAFELTLQRAAPADAKAALLLSQCIGDEGMVGGQCADLTTEGAEVDLDLLHFMDEGKTVALIRAACQMGCIAGGGSETTLAAAGAYAEGLGMAFQIRDDILDVTGETEKLGKNTGMDTMRDKRNYVSLLGLEKAQKLVEQYTEQAVSSLSQFSGDTTFVCEFARTLAERDR